MFISVEDRTGRIWFSISYSMIFTMSNMIITNFKLVIYLTPDFVRFKNRIITLYFLYLFIFLNCLLLNSVYTVLPLKQSTSSWKAGGKFNRNIYRFIRIAYCKSRCEIQHI